MDKQAFRFFVANAGYVEGRRALGAAQLVRAEQAAAWQGWGYEWMSDDDGPNELGDHGYWCAAERRGEKHDHEVLGCILRDSDGRVLDSLWGIIDADSNYRRVVEAELALGALLP